MRAAASEPRDVPMKITGATRLYAIVGDPVAQARSPEVFSERFAAAGIDAVLIPVHILAAHFEAVFSSLLQIANLDGVLVTAPFKGRAVGFAQRVGMSGRAVGAVNAMRRDTDGVWSADMFDGLGFVRGAERKGNRIQGRRVALFGAGGAGSAIACALAAAGVASIDLIEPDQAKASTLIGRLRQLFPDRRFTVASSVPAATDMVVNASPVGMRGSDGLPGEIGELDRSSVIGDVVISEAPTPIVQLAMKRGYSWVAGRDMHSGQVDALLDFFGQPSTPAEVAQSGAVSSK